MPFFHILILALVQGITEFLPISSSGHLVLVHAAMQPDTSLKALQEDLLMDVAVHVGTLFSVLVYFRRDVLNMIRGAFCLLKGQREDQGAQLSLFVIIASVPVIIAGFILHKWDPTWVRGVEIMAWMTLIFGIVLWLADRKKNVTRNIGDMRFKDALLIGLAQSLALVPGVSRSGITMTAARWRGFSRSESAHFSLLLAIVAIAGAGTLAGIDLYEGGNILLTLDALLAALLAFASALIAIHLMMRWLEKATFTPFAIYRVILGSVLLGLIYGGII